MPNRLFNGNGIEKTSLPFPQTNCNTVCFQTTAEETAYRVETAGPVVATSTVAATMYVKAPDYRKDMLVRAKLQFEGFDNATQPQKPHWESVRPVFAFP